MAEVAAVAEKIVAELRDELGALLPAAVVEHVGATSLPFGVTKGDVDVAVSVRVGEFDDAVGMLRSRCEIAQAENWTETYASFSLSDRPLPVGLQVAVIGSPDDFLVPLRDLFRARPDLLAAYDACKREAAYLGAQAYWAAKDRFLRNLLLEHLPEARPAFR